MRRPVLLAAATAVASCVLSVFAVTQSAPPGAVAIPDNRVSTGALHLDLSGGAAQARLSFAGLLPGGTYARQVWVAVNDRRSVVSGALTVRVGRVRDVPARCDFSRDKALAEQASGVAGCSVQGNVATGTPVQGNLSRLLHLDIRSSPGGGCDSADHDVLGTTGTLRSLAGTTLRLGEGGRRPVLRPGSGVCLVVGVRWPPHATSSDSASPTHPLDNAAQGDSLSMRVVFTIVQVSS